MNIDAIFHLADIHIRMLKRHKEYRSAYEKLFEKANEIKDQYENPIAVIAGDIVHAKIDISPELIKMITELMEGLSSIMPVYVYPGNHDANLNNPSRMDTLDPILELISKSSNVTYVRGNDVIEFDNMRIHHMSVFEDRDTYTTADKLTNDKLNFVVYHGAVNNSTTDSNFKLSSERITVDMFDGFDGVILGDIHKRQCLQTRSNGKPEIWYPGSFVQQDHGENINGHGGLVWEISNDINVMEWEIDHDYGYITIPVKNGKVYKTGIQIPRRPRIRLKVEDTSIAQLKKVKSRLRKEFKVQDIQIQKNKSTISIDDISSQIDLGDMHDVEYQNTIIKEYVMNRWGAEIDDDVLNDICEINRDVNKLVGTKRHLRNVTWKPIRFEFSNTMSYGENNVVNFDSLEGIYGLFAPNTSGKSSLLDSILFALFDRISRTSKATHVLNMQRETLYTKFVFELSEKTYVIERKGKKISWTGSVKVDVDFYILNPDGTTESLNGEHRKQTNKIINDYIGTYEDFILTAFSLQNMNTNFIDMKQSDRKYTLSQFLDITIFDELALTAKEEAKEVSSYIRKEQQNNYDEAYAENKQLYEDIVNKVKSLAAMKATLKTNIEELSQKCSEKTLQIVNQITDIDIDYEQMQLQEIIDNQRILEMEQKEHEVAFLMTSESFAAIDRRYDREEFEKAKAKHDEYVNVSQELNQLNSDISKIETKISHHKDILSHLSEHKYNPECDVCVENNSTYINKASSVQSDISELEDKLTDLNSRYLQRKQLLEEFVESEVQYAELSLLRDDYAETQAKYFSMKDILLRFDDKSVRLESIKTQTLHNIEMYEQNQTAIEFNRKLQQDIDMLESEIEVLRSSLESVEMEISSADQKIGYHRRQLEDIDDRIKKLQEAEDKYKVYDYYIKTVLRDGLPKNIIDESLPKIEQEVNRILNQLVDFNIVLRVDNNDIEAHIAYSDDRYWPLELSSGMERFISSLAIRVALINITSLPKPNFIAIDEGWGSLSNDNLNNMFMLFDYLKTEFEFVFIISHIESMRDMVDGLIEINKIDNFSKVNI